MTNLPEGFNDVGGEVAEPAAPAPAVGDVPVPELPTNLTVPLPGGYLDDRGRLHTTASVRELTGLAEEAMARINITENLGAFMGTVLRFGVERIGDLDASDHMLKSLIQGDRQTLLLGIRRATYGDTLEKTLICECGAKSDVEINLKTDITIRPLTDPLVRVRPVTLRNGKVAHVRIPDGFAEEDLLSPENARKTVKELNTILLTNIVEDIDGNPIRKDDIQRLGAADRKTLMDFIRSVQPGPAYEECEVPCSTCQRKYPLEVDLDDLLQP